MKSFYESIKIDTEGAHEKYGLRGEGFGN